MSNVIQLQLGMQPWMPARGLRVVEEFNHYDMPTAGLLRRGWRREFYLFRCMGGQSGQYSLWAYATLTAGDVRALRKLEGPELRQMQNEILARGAVELAVAEEDAGIVHRTSGTLVTSSAEPRVAPEVLAKVEREINSEARAIGSLAAFC